MSPKRTLCVLLICLPLFFVCNKYQKLDLSIKNGTVYNGIESVPTTISIGIQGDKIAFIGHNREKAGKSLLEISQNMELNPE